MENRVKILIIEDDEGIAHFIEAVLNQPKYQCIWARTYQEAKLIAHAGNLDCILLDLGLPDGDGQDLLVELRTWLKTPIIVISARDREMDKVMALDHGADDYMTKPIGASELLARIRTALRHGINLFQNADEQIREVKDLKVDFSTRQVWINNEIKHFTPIEFKILAMLMQNQGKVLTHEMITNEIWGPYLEDPQILRVNMANIRRKLEVNPAKPEYIITEAGVGYRFCDDED